MSSEQIDAILSDFGQWLREMAHPLSVPGPSPGFTWSALVEHLVALRHEVQLNTRALRQQQEQTAELLRQGRGRTGHGQLSSVETQGTSMLRACLESLIELADVHARWAAEFQRILEEESGAPALETPVAEPRASWSRRWWDWFRGASRRRWASSLPPTDKESGRSSAGVGSGLREKLSSLAEGLRIGRERIARILRRHGLEPIRTVGQPFDPQTMEVVEVTTAGPDLPPGQVVAEIRGGFLWQGSVFRTAQVKVARSPVRQGEVTP